MDEIMTQVRDAVRFLCEKGNLAPGALIVLGASTSEIGGGVIGKSGSPELGEAVIRGALAACDEHDVYLAVQCCEHLNRALVLEDAARRARNLPRVMVVPQPTAGGSCAAAAFRLMQNPTVVESIQADAGLDIGDTLIGMHLMPVAVPVRPESKTIGQARLVMAVTRPKYIGGPRARYE